MPNKSFANQLLSFEAKSFTEAYQPGQLIKYEPILGGTHPEPLDCPVMLPGLEN